MALVENACQEDLGNAVLVIEVTPNSNYKMEHFSYKSEWEMNKDALKRRLAFSFTIINLA